MSEEPNTPGEGLVSTPEELAACCAYLAGCPRLGFDTEFVGEDTYHPRLCLVQVATPERLFLIDPMTAGPLDAFWQLVVDPARLVVVHAGREEVRLCQLWAGLPPGNLFDLQIAAGLAGLAYPLGHGPLVGQVLRIHLSKGETLTEWRVRPLTREQIRYAFDDVRYLLPVWERLSRKLRDRGREDWAAEEFARMKAAALVRPEETEKFRKLRGVGSLDRRRLAVVRELYAWREERAAHYNRPARTVVRDDLLVEIARRNPTRVRDLEVVRGLAKRELPAIVEVVARARALPPELCPQATEREQDPPQVGLVANILTAVLADWAARNGVAPGLAATSNDVKLLVRARLHGQELPEESLLTRGWRAAHVLPEVLAVLDGKRSLRIVNVASATPFALSDAPPSSED